MMVRTMSSERFKYLGKTTGPATLHIFMGLDLSAGLTYRFNEFTWGGGLTGNYAVVEIQYSFSDDLSNYRTYIANITEIGWEEQ